MLLRQQTSISFSKRFPTAMHFGKMYIRHLLRDGQLKSTWNFLLVLLFFTARASVTQVLFTYCDRVYKLRINIVIVKLLLSLTTFKISRPSQKALLLLCKIIIDFFFKKEKFSLSTYKHFSQDLSHLTISHGNVLFFNWESSIK